MQQNTFCSRILCTIYYILVYIYIRYEVTRKKRNRLHGGQCIVKRPCITRNREERVRATESNENVHRCIRFSFSFFPLFSSLSLFLILSAHDLSLPSNSLRRDESKANWRNIRTYRRTRTLLIALNTYLLKNSSWKICYKCFTRVCFFLKPIFHFFFFSNYDKNSFLFFSFFF